MSSLAQASKPGAQRWGLGALIVIAIIAVQAFWLYLRRADRHVRMRDHKIMVGSLMTENSTHIPTGIRCRMSSMAFCSTGFLRSSRPKPRSA
jgi:hypothetical protein